MKQTWKDWMFYAVLISLVAAAAYATDAKISALSAGAPMQLSDAFPVARSGNNAKLTGDDVSGEQCTKTLTEGAATAILNVTVASGAGAGGRVIYHVFASDATNHQSLPGMFYFSAVNKAGTLSLGDSGSPPVIGVPSTATSSGTLTCTPTYVANGNSIDIKLNCTSSLTQNVFTAWSRIELIGGGTPTCQ